METTLKYFKGSFAFAIMSVVAGYMLGGWKAAWIVAVLCVLEVSLSFDNAVVNATVLKDMDEKWKHRFLTWGMVIAVFGMRIVFPVIIVMIVGSLGPIEAISTAISDPDRYAAIMKSSHVAVAGFGGSFLMLVFLSFFLDREKDVHWVHAIEEPLQKLGHEDTARVALTLLVVYAVSKFVPSAEVATLWAASALGIVTFILVEVISGAMERHEEAKAAAGVVVKSGAASFLYLELLDASFSFDGVIGAFALTNNIFIIALGLGTGAFFVRSLTIMLVDKGTLEQFRYLEHGAFYAIGALATIMYVGTSVHVSESITGLIGAAFIGLALISSVAYNKREAGKSVTGAAQAESI